MRFEEISPKKIIVEDRHRLEMGEIDDLGSSFKATGIIQPIVVNQNYRLLAGGRRLAAALSLKMRKVPIVIRETDSELMDKEIELVENIQRKDMEWHEECLLIQRIYDLYKQKHGRKWSSNKTAQLLGKANSTISRKMELANALKHIPELTEAPNEDAAVATLKKIQEQLLVQELKKQHLADVVPLHATEGEDTPTQKEESQTGEESPDAAHVKRILRLADGNYNKEQDFFKAELAPNMWGFIEVDPPYAIDLHKQKKAPSKHGGLRDYNEIDRDQYVTFCSDTAKRCFELAKPNAWMVHWFGIEWYDVVRKSLMSAGWAVDPIPGIWAKGSGQTQSPELYLARTYETFFVCRKGAPTLQKRGRSNVFAYPPVPAKAKYHPTQRPLDLMRELLLTFTYPRERILVPFGGSGATLLAMYQLGEDRVGVTYDLSKTYKDYFLLAAAGIQESMQSEAS